MGCYNYNKNKHEQNNCCNKLEKNEKKDICRLNYYVISTIGITGPTDATGPQGESGILNYADFYVLMPPDNAETVAPWTDVIFPQDGPNSGSIITRTGDDSFNLGEIGKYQISFQASIDESGQLVLTLNSNELAYTVVGRATGTSQIIGIAIFNS